MKFVLFIDQTQDFEFLYLIDVNLSTNAFQEINLIMKFIIICGFILSLLIGSYFKSAIYLYMYAKRKFLSEKPIDILMLVQAIVQHLMSTLMIFTYVIGLLLDTSISKQLGGEAWCIIPFYGGNYGVAYRVVGGLIIAFYRLIYLFCGDWIKWKMERKRLLYFLVILSITIPGILTKGYAMGNGPVSRKQAMWNFCIGKSEEFRSVLHEYGILRGTISFEPEHVPGVVLFICMLCVVVELVCYLVFFGHLYRHDREMLKKKRLKSEVIRRRNQKNAITFFGQFWTFLTECTCLSLVIISIGGKSDIMYRVIAIIAFWIEFGIVSIVEVWTSGSLVDYLPHNVILRRVFI